MHNTLWPTGFYPEKYTHQFVLLMDKLLFWKKTPYALISVSPECERQVRHLVPNLPYPTYQVRAQFLKDYFAPIVPPIFPKNGVFEVLFIGRIEKMKGVFDILDMAQYVNKVLPGKVKWRICGRGADLDALTQKHQEMGLQDSVELVGWVSLEQLYDIYGKTHSCIVPTRSIFTEALAMTAVEAVLAGRPVVSNPVVPATEILAPACLLGKTNDYLSHAEAVITLATNQVLYDQLRDACKHLADEFLDPERSLGVAVKKIISELEMR